MTWLQYYTHHEHTHNMMWIVNVLYVHTNYMWSVLHVHWYRPVMHCNDMAWHMHVLATNWGMGWTTKSLSRVTIVLASLKLRLRVWSLYSTSRLASTRCSVAVAYLYDQSKLRPRENWLAIPWLPDSDSVVTVSPAGYHQWSLQY